MKLLVVEDERVAANFLCKGLREEGYVVDVARDSSKAEELVAISEYDAILLDVLIPGKHGFDLCNGWRQQGIRTPVIFLTALDDLDDRIRGARYRWRRLPYQTLFVRGTFGSTKGGAETCERQRVGIGDAIWDLTIDLARRKVSIEDSPVESYRARVSDVAAVRDESGANRQPDRAMGTCLGNGHGTRLKRDRRLRSLPS